MYEQRVREVEHSSFTPPVLSATSGMANEAITFCKRLASCLTMKWDYPCSSTMSWLRCRLTFSSAQPSTASGVPGLAVAMLSSHHPPLTWPSPNCNVSKLLDSFQLSTLSIQCQHFYTIWHYFIIPYMSLYNVSIITH